MSKLDIVFYYNNCRDLPAFKIFHNTAINDYNYWLISKYNAFDIDVYLLLDSIESNIIALDWDNTISSDIELYQQLIKEWRKAGFEPIVCSLREDDNENRTEIRKKLEDETIPLHLTNGIAKLKFMMQQNLSVHLWLDDFFPAICQCNNQLVRRNGIDY
ncbi:MAG: hypothetical protein KAH22_10130 [Thiotrichaceae bacterium]|nr:hypothetical protein [Thiotrichaceae bacterium]